MVRPRTSQPTTKDLLALLPTTQGSARSTAIHHVSRMFEQRLAIATCFLEANYVQTRFMILTKDFRCLPHPMLPIHRHHPKKMRGDGDISSVGLFAVSDRLVKCCPGLPLPGIFTARNFLRLVFFLEHKWVRTLFPCEYPRSRLRCCSRGVDALFHFRVD